MFRSFFKIFFRNLAKRKGYTFINVAGLAIGLAGCGLITLLILDEWKVDRFHEKGDQVFRVITDVQTTKGGEEQISSVGRPLAETISREVPEVQDVLIMRRSGFSIKHNQEYFYDKFLYAGQNFFKFFSFKLLKGDPNKVLSEPYTVVLKKSIAGKYFRSTDPVGKTLLLNDSLPFKVTGIVDDLQTSHIDFDVLVSLPTFFAMGGTMNQWFTWDQYCYVSLKPNANVKQATSKISSISMRHNGDEYRNSGYNVSHSLEQLNRIHLYSKLGGINRPAGSAQQLYLVAAIGFFLLLLASINFINLTTARHAERAKEVGVRKTIGAGYKSLIGQFIAESIMLVFIAGAFAFGVIQLSLPFMNELVEKTLRMDVLMKPVSILIIITFLFLTGILSGWYPALLLAKFKPVKVLKGHTGSENSGGLLRRSLVVFQFTISLILVICTLIAGKQLTFMQSRDLGFNKDQVLVIDGRKAPRKQFIDEYESIKQDLSSLAAVKSASVATGFPGRSGWQGQLVWAQDRPSEEAVTMEAIPVDMDFVKTLGLKIISGRDYSKDFPSDKDHGMLLNRKACEAFGWKPEVAVGKHIRTSGVDSGVVIGVIENYHQHGLQEEIAPITTFIAPYAFGYIALRLNNTDHKTVISQVQSYWKSHFPGYPFEYFFLADDFEQQYKSEKRIADTFKTFAIIAIVIACLGLFGLATFMAEKRTKEIGIRKVLGASVSQVATLLSTDFIKLVLVSNLFAWPIAWWWMNNWLEDFAYRTPLSWTVFVMAAVGTVVIALVTVSFQAIRAALSNPVKSLRTE